MTNALEDSFPASLVANNFGEKEWALREREEGYREMEGAKSFETEDVVGVDVTYFNKALWATHGSISGLTTTI